MRKARDLLAADLPRNPHLGEGVLDPNPIDADAVLEEITRITAGLILNGPSLDDLEWYGLLSDEDPGDAA